MKPKPFVALNHLTVPVAIDPFPSVSALVRPARLRHLRGRVHRRHHAGHAALRERGSATPRRTDRNANAASALPRNVVPLSALTLLSPLTGRGVWHAKFPGEAPPGDASSRDDPLPRQRCDNSATASFNEY